MRLKLLSLFAVILFPATLFAQQSQVKNFDTFWKIFNDDYAFFDLHKVNWKVSYQKHRPLVTNNISDDSLFNVMSFMVKPLGDSHVNIIDSKRKKKFNAAGYSQFAADFKTDSLKNAFWTVDDTVLQANGFGPITGHGAIFKGKHLFYFARSANYGYLRFSRCFAKITDGEIDEKDFEMQVLDSLMVQCKNLKGLIIDVRANIGGDDKFSYDVAGRFTAKPVTGHYKQERIAKTNKYTKLQNCVIKPLGSYAFTKPVMLLTNSKTVSAAEVFTLAMKQLPYVKTIGEATEGNLSDMFSEDLPNGWTVTLSNQKYYSPKMVCYEGAGVPVDIKASNSLQQLNAGTDDVLSAALTALNKAAK